MNEKIAEVVTCAQEASRSGDPLALSDFRTKLIEYLDVQQPCAKTVFDGLLDVLKSLKLASYSEYGNLLADLAISEFAFTESQKELLKNSLEELFFNIDQPVSRMQACHLFSTFQSREFLALQLLRLLKKARQEHFPQAELVWELASLINEDNISSGTMTKIQHSLPKKQ